MGEFGNTCALITGTAPVLVILMTSN